MSAWTEARDRQMIADGWVRRPDGYWEQPKVKLGPNYGTAKPDLVLDNGTKVHMPPPKLPKRIRQSSKPLMNKLEESFKAEYLDPWGYKNAVPQAIRFKLGNGIWFKPDWVDLTVLPVYAWEIKGPFAHRGGFENLKVAAGLYPNVKWVLAWKDEAGQWQRQTILP